MVKVNEIHRWMDDGWVDGRMGKVAGLMEGW